MRVISFCTFSPLRHFVYVLPLPRLFFAEKLRDLNENSEYLESEVHRLLRKVSFPVALTLLSPVPNPRLILGVIQDDYVYKVVHFHDIEELKIRKCE